MEQVQDIYRNSTYCITYNEGLNEFQLINKSEVVELRFCELMALKKKIQSIDVIAMFDTACPDLEIVSLPGCNRLLVLSLEEILQLRDLLSGTFTMLELNHVLHESLYIK